MGEYSVFLNMIVKNESKIIERCMDAVKWIDGIVISDTGSMDNTVEIIEAWRDRNGKRGAVVRNEWKNFGHNRTQALVEGRKWCFENGYDLDKVYFLLIDADMIFRGDTLKGMVHQADLWDVRQQNTSIIYSNLRVVRASLDVVCVCPTHEYYDIRTPDTVRKTYEDTIIEDVGDGGAKDNKAQRDIRMLKEGLTEEPKNPRYWFYLANTYRDIHDFPNAIIGYNSRIEIGGWFEETYCSMVYKGDCHSALGQYALAVESWLDAYQVDPARGEALIRLATYYRTISKHNTAMLFVEKGLKMALPDRVLFLEKSTYQYKFLYELSICAFYTKDFSRGRVACEMLLNRTDLAENVRQSIIHNQEFYSSSNKKK